MRARVRPSAASTRGVIAEPTSGADGAGRQQQTEARLRQAHGPRLDDEQRQHGELRGGREVREPDADGERPQDAVAGEVPDPLDDVAPDRGARAAAVGPEGARAGASSDGRERVRAGARPQRERRRRRRRARRRAAGRRTGSPSARRRRAGCWRGRGWSARRRSTARSTAPRCRTASRRCRGRTPPRRAPTAPRCRWRRGRRARRSAPARPTSTRTIVRRRSSRSARAPAGRANSSQGRRPTKVTPAKALGSRVMPRATSGRATRNTPSARFDKPDDVTIQPERTRDRAAGAAARFGRRAPARGSRVVTLPPGRATCRPAAPRRRRGTASTSATCSTRPSAAACSARTNPSATARSIHASSPPQVPATSRSTTGLATMPSWFQVSTSASSSRVPSPPGRATNPSAEVVHELLALVHRGDLVHRGQPGVGDLPPEQPLRDDADDLAPAPGTASASDAHQPDGAPAVDEGDARAGELASERSAAALNCGSAPDGRAAEHAHPAQFDHGGWKVVLADPLVVGVRAFASLRRPWPPRISSTAAARSPRGSSGRRRGRCCGPSA